MREQKRINTELCHDILVQKIVPKLAYTKECDYTEWKDTLKEKFYELTGLNDIPENTCPLNIQIEWEEDKGTHKMLRFTFDSEVGETVPCYLLIPNTGKEKYPVAIVLQGHTTGFHLSIGEYKEGDERYLEKRNNEFAIQAVQNGFIALAIEQRGLGERKPLKGNRLPKNNCQYASRTALEMGRTILAERVWDVHRAIDTLSAFPKCDLDKILITGNSGGGTASYYAACYDERIQLCVPSCSFSPYKESILSIAHCACNYIPSAFKYFDMQDLACMIAPRKLVVITGKEDTIFPIEGVRRGFETVKAIYERNHAGENCRIIETPKDHWWCEDIVWPAIQEEVKKLGW